MKSINEDLFTGYSEMHPGVYLSGKGQFWTFLAAGPIIEEGYCDWWYDVAEAYPNDTIIFYPIDTTVDMLELGPDTIYRGVMDLDQDPEIICRYAVIRKVS